MTAPAALPAGELMRFQAANAQGVNEMMRGNPGRALAYYGEALEMRREPALLSNYGDALAKCGRVDEARLAFEEAVAIDPAYDQGWYNLAVTYETQGEWEKAKAAYRRSIACRLTAPAVNNLGNLEFWTLELAECERHYRSAVKHGFQEAIYNLALVLMMRGKFTEGWDWYQYRPQMKDMRSRSTAWRGEDLEGRTLLIVTEQGLGDSVFALRYLPIVAGRAARVIVACDPGLKRLIDAMGLPNVHVMEKAAMEHLPRFDYECMMMSLPGYVTPDGVAPGHKYLRAPALPKNPKDFVVGLCWNGSTAVGYPAERNIPLAMLKPLSEIPGVRFVSLQRGDGVDEIATCGFAVEDAMASCADLLDTATVIEGCDLVITIDTLIPHLAGGLGRPTWLLNRHGSCWQWGSAEFDPQLYDFIFQFRQPSRGAWAPVVEQVTHALRRLMQPGFTISADDAAKIMRVVNG